MRHRRDIEGLRAIAVAAVLLYHFGVPGVGGGYVGVDVFFVISGFLITSLLVDERTTTGRISISRFYARRARRLLPISATVIAATAVAGIVWLPPTRLDNLAEEARAAAAFAANLLFADRGTNYLTADLESPLQHYWSLAVEEQFYLVWPGMIALITLGARRVRSRTAWAMAAVIATSFAASTLLTQTHQSWSYFGLHTRAWELGVGAFLACVVRDTDRRRGPIRAALGWLGLLGILVSIATFGDVVVFPGYAAALPVLSTGLVLLAGDLTVGAPTVLLRQPPLQYVGTRSYSLYLWHWPVLVIAEGHLLRSLTLAEKVLAGIATVTLAELGYRAIEHPIRSSKALIRHPSVSLVVGAALVATGVVGATVVADYDPDLSTGRTAAAPTIATSSTATSSPPTAPPATGPLNTATSAVETTTTMPLPPRPITTSGILELPVVVEALAQTVAPDNLRPSLGSAPSNAPPIYGNGCHQFHATQVSSNCVFGDPDGEVTIALWGDSHAAQWFTPFNTIAVERGWRLLSLTQGSCAYIEVVTFDLRNNSQFRNCVPWRESVRAYMREQGVDAVLLSQHYGLFAADDKKVIDPEHWQMNLPTLIDSLRADGIEPIVIGDSPDPASAVPDCIANNRRSVNACAVRMYNAEDLNVVEAIRSLTAAASVSFIEPGEWVCGDDSVCPAIIGDILVYRDGNHLSDTIAGWLAPVIDASIGQFIADLYRYRALVHGTAP